MATALDGDIDRRVLETVTKSSTRLTPLELKQRLKIELALKRGQFESSLKRLVRRKELVYTYQFGLSFLEPCFERPVRITPSIVLKPPACEFEARTGDAVVNLRSGAAFGSGCHPTTRLSLKAIDAVRVERSYLPGGGSKRVLDVGTGSGVLLIAALKLGMDAGVGLDIDPCARAEARENARLNLLGDRIDISSRAFEKIAGSFAMVIANLRLPTLKTYFAQMIERVENGGALIVSGIKTNEINTIKTWSHKGGLTVGWEGAENGWAALALHQCQKKNPA